MDNLDLVNNVPKQEPATVHHHVRTEATICRDCDNMRQQVTSLQDTMATLLRRVEELNAQASRRQTMPVPTAVPFPTPVPTPASTPTSSRRSSPTPPASPSGSNATFVTAHEHEDQTQQTDLAIIAYREPEKTTAGNASTQITFHGPEMTGHVSDLMGNELSRMLAAAMNFRNMLSGPNPPIDEILRTGVLPRLVLSQQEAFHAIAKIVSFGNTVHNHKVISAGALDMFVNLVENITVPGDAEEHPLQTLSHIAGHCTQCSHIILSHYEVLGPLIVQGHNIAYEHYMHSWRMMCFRCTALCLGKILMCWCKWAKPDIRKMIMHDGVYPILIDVLRRADCGEAKEGAAMALSSALSGGKPDRVKMIVEQGGLPPLCEMLVPGTNTTILEAILVGLEKTLIAGERMGHHREKNPHVILVKNGHGLERLQELQSHEDPRVAHLALKLLTEWLT